MGIGKFLEAPLSMLPYKSFISLYPKFKDTIFSDAADTVFNRNFLRFSPLLKDKEKYIDTLLANPQYMLIKSGLWEYKLANFCFIKDMLSIILWCLERGYVPIVDIYPPQNGCYSCRNDPLWTLFFYQPLQLDTIVSKKDGIICPITTSSVRPSFFDAFDSKNINFWHEVLETFVVYKKETIDYFEKEYVKLIKGKKVVACVLRSTDYTKLCPKGHPIQPSLHEVIKKLHEVMGRFSIDYVYLATEDYRIATRFRKEFPNRVIENERHYYNEQYDNNDLELISQVHFNRKNDDYLKVLEYMSSINLVSKCDYLVSGLCGGSEMAIYRNGNKYKYKYIFDKGVY